MISHIKGFRHSSKHPIGDRITVYQGIYGQRKDWLGVTLGFAGMDFTEYIGIPGFPLILLQKLSFGSKNYGRFTFSYDVLKDWVQRCFLSKVPVSGKCSDVVSIVLQFPKKLSFHEQMVPRFVTVNIEASSKEYLKENLVVPRTDMIQKSLAYLPEVLVEEITEYATNPLPDELIIGVSFTLKVPYLGKVINDGDTSDEDVLADKYYRELEERRERQYYLPFESFEDI